MDKVVKNKSIGAKLIKSLLASYIVTGFLLLIVALLLFKMNLSEGKVNIGILVTYILSSFIGGFIIGKSTQTKKFIWGILLGTIYFLVLSMISFMVNKGFQGDVTGIVTTLVMCVGSGMLGGMLS
jgi:putative membrane protein, TIGR04086 family/integral membrane protein, TIGR04097 family